MQLIGPCLLKNDLGLVLCEPIQYTWAPLGGWHVTEVYLYWFIYTVQLLYFSIVDWIPALISSFAHLRCELSDYYDFQSMKT